MSVPKFFLEPDGPFSLDAMTADEIRQTRDEIHKAIDDAFDRELARIAFLKSEMIGGADEFLH